ncbi:N-acyl-D-glucosamine 2-epimerase [Paenibacillus sp. FSL H8-0548]|uniref:AGE family epimerase/isomerase n=1 Tax=Paenibacillus sp. FSL H8-0548 TaxID=1920422 RepID=UPI00096C9E75|nr:AGE family epimerase/isomerase [Paenibacillus sp. FSL H8-0548]OMF23492.1 N-acyl-D-glucosamine 2-epimerase [Paenibacillus sp. FSL H8-0548]
MNDTNHSWLASIKQELESNILGFWMKHTIDETNGGFFGLISCDLTVYPEAGKSLVLNTRILWTFASAYRMTGKDEYLKIAERAYRYINNHFADHEFGGLYWMVDALGRAAETKKQVYGQAFAIYAFSEYYRATGNEAALQQAIELFRTLERYSYDQQYKGYFEALTREWQETSDNSLSEKDLNEKKSMNTHLHVMEGYTNLYRVWKSDELHAKLKELIEITIQHIINANNAHFILFFDEQWNGKSEHISYGHDIEGSWLLVEAAEVLGDEALLAEAKAIAIRMAEATLNEGLDEDGGLFNEAGPEGLLDSDKDWWPQAEAVVGFYNAYQMTGDEKYEAAAKKSWQFIEQFIVDKEHGEWYWSVTRNGSPSDNIEKVSPWKCPYHNGRACFEMIERLTGASPTH